MLLLLRRCGTGVVVGPAILHIVRVLLKSRRMGIVSQRSLMHGLRGGHRDRERDRNGFRFGGFAPVPAIVRVWAVFRMSSPAVRATAPVVVACAVAVFFFLEVGSFVLDPLLFLLVLLMFVKQVTSGYHF